MKLHLCILYPGGDWTPEMQYSIVKLNNVLGSDLILHLVEGGKFSHRHDKKTSDKLQCELRQLYLDAVPDGEWMLVLDSDEALHGTFGDIRKTLEILEASNRDVGMITEFRPDGTMSGRPRFIKKREGLQYGGIPNKEGTMWKHDVIAHKVCGPVKNSTAFAMVCRYHPDRRGLKYNNTECYNYIDVDNNTRFVWVRNFWFFHQKDAMYLDVLKYTDVNEEFTADQINELGEVLLNE